VGDDILMVISLSQINDYIKCPQYYQYKYNYKLEEKAIIEKEYSEKIHEIIYHFFYRVLDKQVPGLHVLRDKWESLWFKKKIDPLQYLTTPKNPAWEMGVSGATLLTNFYNSNYQDPGAPLLINHSFTFPYGDHEITGQFEVVREIQDGPRRVIELIIYKTGRQTPTQWTVDNNLTISILSAAFRYLLRAKEQREVVYHLRSNKTFSTYRTKEELDKALKIVDRIVEGITQNIFYPRHSFICNNCSYKNYCGGN
jgi:CRISPR/Cas system-associated exonuclease Cas4 (RecB family)